MKTLYLTRGGSNIIVDTETNSADKLQTRQNGIDYVYLAEEPMHVVYGCGEYKRELDVQKGDIIITFYHKRFKNQIIVVKNEDWTENLVLKEQEEQLEKEMWANANLSEAKCANVNTCESI